MKKTAKLFRITIIVMVLFSLMVTACDDAANPAPTVQTVKKPTATPAGGTYTTAQSVTLATSTEGADIYYTINGSNPTTSSTLYSTAINISVDTTLKAIAIKDGINNSDMLTAVYTINTPPGTVVTPMSNPPAGTYGTVQSVTLSTTTAGASIYYTINGTDPTTGSTVYSAPININTTTTLKAIAIKDGMTNSTIMTEVYTIGHIVTFDADGGSPAPHSPVTENPGSTINQPPAMTKAWHTFGGWYTDSDRTVPAAFPITVNTNVNLYAKWTVNTFFNVTDMRDYLASLPSNAKENPASLTLSFNLGTMTAVNSGWRQILDAVNTTGKYVNLNLSACTMTGTSFNPDSSVATGKDRITSLVLPTVATSIETGSPTDPTFRNFSNLESISGAYVTTIGSSAFYSSSGNTILKNTEFPHITNIGSYAFYRCTGLQSVNFPQVTTIGINAFERCTGLTSLSFPQVTTIEEDAFSGCTGLQSASFPASAELGRSFSTYSNPFAGCTSLASFTLTGIGALSVIENGKALLRNGTALLAYPSASGSVYFASSSPVTSIDSKAFYGCINLTDASLGPNNADGTPMVIGSMAFYGCTSLQSISSLNIESIGYMTFYGCTKLGTGTGSIFLQMLKTIGDSAFQGCTNLPSTMTFNYVTSVGMGAFMNCTSLTSVTFRDATSIDSTAFWNCTGLQTLVIPKVKSIGNNALSYTGTTPLSITMGGDVSPTLGYQIFSNITSAKMVTVKIEYSATGYSPAASPFMGTSVTVSGTDTTANWANGLRGGGWTGTTWASGSSGGTAGINQNITVTIQQQ